MPALEAAEQASVQVIWDLFHYGSPDHVDQAAPDFPDRFAEFAARGAQSAAVGQQPAAAGLPAQRDQLSCHGRSRSNISRASGPKKVGWFKRQLVRTATTAARAIRQHWPEATLVWAEPLVHVAPHSHRRAEVRAAEQYRQGQFEAYDWIIGRAEPELGGDPSFVDVVGLNFYPHNQWYYRGPTIPMGHHEYRPLADMLLEVADRYGKPDVSVRNRGRGDG